MVAPMGKENQIEREKEMRAVEIVRLELQRVNVQGQLPLHVRRKLVKLAKQARRNGENPRSVVSRALTR